MHPTYQFILHNDVYLKLCQFITMSVYGWWEKYTEMHSNRENIFINFIKNVLIFIGFFNQKIAEEGYIKNVQTLAS